MKIPVTVITQFWQMYITDTAQFLPVHGETP